MNPETLTIEEVMTDHRAQHINKQIWNGKDFQPVTYYRLPLARHARKSAERWLQSQFGTSKIHETWWSTSGNIFMTQQIYFWWCLAHGVNERE
jgi:hypothetical protein